MLLNCSDNEGVCEGQVDLIVNDVILVYRTVMGNAAWIYVLVKIVFVESMNA